MCNCIGTTCKSPRGNNCTLKRTFWHILFLFSSFLKVTFESVCKCIKMIFSFTAFQCTVFSGHTGLHSLMWWVLCLSNQNHLLLEKKCDYILYSQYVDVVFCNKVLHLLLLLCVVRLWKWARGMVLGVRFPCWGINDRIQTNPTQQQLQVIQLAGHFLLSLSLYSLSPSLSHPLSPPLTLSLFGNEWIGEEQAQSLHANASHLYNLDVTLAFALSFQPSTNTWWLKLNTDSLETHRHPWIHS